MENSLLQDLFNFFQKVSILANGLQCVDNPRDADQITAPERLSNNKVWYYMSSDTEEGKRATTRRQNPMPVFHALKFQGKTLWEAHRHELDTTCALFNEALFAWDWEVVFKGAWIYSFISVMREVRMYEGTASLFECLYTKREVWETLANVQYAEILQYYQPFATEEQGVVIDLLYQVSRQDYLRFNEEDARALIRILKLGLVKLVSLDLRAPTEELRDKIQITMDSELVKAAYLELWTRDFHYDPREFGQAYTTLQFTHIRSFNIAHLPSAAYGVTLPCNTILVDDKVTRGCLFPGKVTVVFLHEFSHALFRADCQSLGSFLGRTTPPTETQLQVAGYDDEFSNWLDSSLPLQKHLEAGDRLEEVLFGERLNVLNLAAANFLLSEDNVKLPREEFSRRFREENAKHHFNKAIPSTSLRRDEADDAIVVLGHCGHQYSR